MADRFEVVPESTEDLEREARLCAEGAKALFRTCRKMRKIAARIETEPGYRPPWFSKPSDGKGRRRVRYEEA